VPCCRISAKKTIQDQLTNSESAINSGAPIDLPQLREDMIQNRSVLQARRRTDRHGSSTIRCRRRLGDCVQRWQLNLRRICYVK
jgi:hypothetical protein